MEISQILSVGGIGVSVLGVGVYLLGVKLFSKKETGRKFECVCMDNLRERCPYEEELNLLTTRRVDRQILALGEDRRYQALVVKGKKAMYPGVKQGDILVVRKHDHTEERVADNSLVVYRSLFAGKGGKKKKQHCQYYLERYYLGKLEPYAVVKYKSVRPGLDGRDPADPMSGLEEIF